MRDLQHRPHLCSLLENDMQVWMRIALPRVVDNPASNHPFGIPLHVSNLGQRPRCLEIDHNSGCQFLSESLSPYLLQILLWLAYPAPYLDLSSSEARQPFPYLLFSI